MPSLANGRFFSPSTYSITTMTTMTTTTTTAVPNISNEILLDLPNFDEDDQIILLSSPTINLIYRIVFPCLIFIGTCGSIMSLKCLYAQRYRKNNATYVFFFFISLVDLAILYTGALRLLIIAMTGYDVRSSSIFVCRFHRFTTYFLLQLSSWLLTLMTLDRARKTLSMLPPLNKTIQTYRTTQLIGNEHHSTLTSRLKQSKMLWITLLVILCLFAIDSHFFYCTGYQHKKNRNEIVCQSVGTNIHCERYWLGYIWIDAFLYSYLPFLLITLCNVRLVIYLHQQRAKRLELTTTHLSHNHRVTCSVILMSALFLILSVPVSFLEQFEYKLNHFKYYYHYLAIAYAGMYFNHTISFFLFLFGTQFRQSVKELIWAQTNQRTNTTLFALVSR